MTKKFLSCLTVVALFMMTRVDWQRGVVRATGFAGGKATTPKGTDLYKAQARRAARMDAQRNLAEAVKGVQVSAESSMADLELESDLVGTRVNAIIKNMREVSEEYTNEGMCRIVLEMPLFGSAESLAAAAFLPKKDQPKVAFPAPTSTTTTTTTTKTTTTTTTTSGYTGVIIDCSGTGKTLNHVMSPVIKNDKGVAVYGHQNLDYDMVIQVGMASYVTKNASDSDKARAGSNPLIIKAVTLEGLDANPVISVADADKMLIANQSDRFLDKCAVVFIEQ